MEYAILKTIGFEPENPSWVEEVAKYALVEEVHDHVLIRDELI